MREQGLSMLLDQVARLFPVSRNFVSYAGGQRHELTWDGDASIRCVNGDGWGSDWLCRNAPEGRIRISCQKGKPASEYLERTLLAVLESAFYFYQDRDGIYLDAIEIDDLFMKSYMRNDESLVPLVDRKLFWQRPEIWLPNHQMGSASGKVQSLSRGSMKHQGLVSVTYRRFIPWLGNTFSFRGVRVEDDLTRFSRWMNDPFVSHFWEEEGDLAHHRDYLNMKQTEGHSLSLMACLDDQPFGYFEVYWAKHDRIAPFCDAQEHDRGWHALIGEADFRGKLFVCAWLPSIAHYLFLDDSRTNRVFVEPRIDNDRMKRNLLLSGYDLIKEFDFPHKRANLFCMSWSSFY